MTVLLFLVALSCAQLDESQLQALPTIFAGLGALQ